MGNHGGVLLFPNKLVNNHGGISSFYQLNVNVAHAMQRNVHYVCVCVLKNKFKFVQTIINELFFLN
jgi:hypothetical protein